MVMAEPISQHEELRSQSVGVGSPPDVPAITKDNSTIGEDVEEGLKTKANGVVTDNQGTKMDDQALEDASMRSDTDTSRAGSVTDENKLSDTKPIKKFPVSKPVSFAKYSVPKATTPGVSIKTTVEKAPSTTPTPTSMSTLGRPRLVAKSASLLQQKPATYRPVAPDPMQVWNKNRVTPQPSTKHLTDEELKQQYGIHLTSRLQSDGDGKEAKWADIDDDEDDWAPETIEWNDGTKTTVNAAEALTSRQLEPIKTNVNEVSVDNGVLVKEASPQYSSSVGPNATVLKVGASAGRQQLQKAAAQQAKGFMERVPASGSRAAPAPPVKSPWAKLPAIDKVSPIAIQPQSSVLQTGAKTTSTLLSSTSPISGAQASSPAKEISADDFSRTWRHEPSNSNRELFMPSSGRYETVSDGRRRPSRNEQNFRAPAVLQRPGMNDARVPAEPSAAFQTHRTSIDLGRRRASSSISGGSGPFARRMSFKSNEAPSVAVDVQSSSQAETLSARQLSQDARSPAASTATYQIRGDHVGADSRSQLEGDLEAQRAAQKAAMKENIDRARKRKIEEEQRLEAEKKERIRLKLASLGPAPQPNQVHTNEAVSKDSSENTQTAPASSPPKPPQPLATGEPQQYGMMKVHPLDTVVKASPPVNQAEILNAASSTQPAHENKTSPPMINGTSPNQEPQSVFPEEEANPEPSPKFSKPSGPAISDARAGWSSVRNEHRQQQTGNLWGLPSNKALGNGTFDQALAGYSPQGLSRTSSTGQPWMNGRTPTVGQSPQLHHAQNHVPDTRSHLLQSMTSPGQQPLSLNSEADSILPASRPAPIGPPPQPQPQQPGHPGSIPPPNGMAGWNNFAQTARANEKAESERFQRELHERREEEKRTGVRQQAPYSFNETFKQVQLGEHAGQRHVSNIAHNTNAPSGMFGAVGSLSPNEPALRTVNGQAGRGSRFFPTPTNGVPQERRAVTYSHPEIPRTPSPPPAEELLSFHPAFEGVDFTHPKVHFPREKAVVRLPPPAVQSPSPPPPPVQEQPAQPKMPLTWAARVSMSAPAPPAPTNRSVSTPMLQNPSWQERFNGLLGKKEAAGRQDKKSMLPTPADAVTKEPFDVLSAVRASVLLPESELLVVDASIITTKDVEDEEDLFEDREAGSLPAIYFPRDTPTIGAARAPIPRYSHVAIDPISTHMFMVHNWSERHAQQKPQYAIVRAPGTLGKGIKRDLLSKSADSTPVVKPRNLAGSFGHKYPRGRSSFKPRGAAKAH